MLALAGLVLLLSGAQADEPKESEGAGKPPWQRLLQGKDTNKAQQLQQQINKHWEAAEFDAALKAAEELATLRQQVQGADHWQAVDADWQRKTIRALLKREAANQKLMAKIPALVREAEILSSRGRYREAQPLREEILKIARQVMGEEYPDTALCYSNLAANHNAQGQYTDAERNLQKALDLYRKLLGEEHPSTAGCYNNLASNQQAVGNYVEAERNIGKALGLFRQLLGEEHPHTATSYNNLAANQNYQGKYAEAERSFARRSTCSANCWARNTSTLPSAIATWPTTKPTREGTRRPTGISARRSTCS
jgi:tetratricopeptide (TPR) repeat protein